MVLTFIASTVIIVQFLLEHFIEDKKWRIIAGLVIMAFAITLIWGSYYHQKNDNESISKNLITIKTQNDTLLIQLKTREFIIDSLNLKVSDLTSISPKLDINGKFLVGSGLSVPSEFSIGNMNIDILYREGKYDEVFKMAKELAGKNSSFGFAYFWMGIIQIHKKDYSSGEQNLLTAIKLETMFMR